MEKFDEFIKDALEKKAETVTPSCFLLQRIKAETAERKRKENFSMKIFSAKKLVVLGVVALMSVSCYAAAKMTGVVASSKNNEITSVSDIGKYDKKLGFTPKYVDSFDNGYKFTRGGTGTTHGVDEDGNSVGKEYNTLNLTYKNDKGQNVMLMIDGGNPYTDNGENTTGYTNQTYKFVPPDYQLTDEDKKEEASGDIVISYGSDKVEIQKMESYMWQDEGLYYTLTAADCNLGEKEMKNMAKQINDNK
ncbi:MAG: hypothetical protein LKJ13_00920 [Clostridia bacterium]|jgi:hypothetical protein|nr:hypothetical protein [Clostridia bacterium]MCI1999368.1 hypothetical protein [Clostridia bacterium]MCI2015130.1 hypothetical protein [Clostridia bacterium]